MTELDISKITSEIAGKSVHSEHEGHVWERIFAAANGEITSTELDNVLAMVGKTSDFEALTQELKELVVEAISKVWTIDKMGVRIQMKDADFFRDSEGFSRAHMDIEYLAGRSADWNLHAIEGVLNAAAAKEIEAKKSACEETWGWVDMFINDVVAKAGDIYHEVHLDSGDKRLEVEAYLDERYDQVREVKTEGISFNQLLDTLSTMPSTK